MRRTLLRKGLREIWERKLQYISLALIMGLGIASYTSFNNMLDSREATLDLLLEESEFMDLRVSFRYGMDANLTDVGAIMDSLDTGDQVEALEYRLVFDVFVSHDDGGEDRISQGQVIGYRAFDGGGIDNSGGVDGDDGIDNGGGGDGNEGSKNSDGGEGSDNDYGGDGAEGGDFRLPSVNRPLFYSDDPGEFTSDHARSCYIESRFSGAYGLSSGETVTVMHSGHDAPLTILERVNVPEYLMVVREGSYFPNERSFCALMVPMGTALDIYHAGGDGPGVVNDIVLRLADGADPGEVRQDLHDAFEAAGIPVDVTDRDENPSYAFLKGDLEGDAEFMPVMPLVIFSISSFGLIMSFRRMIETHRPQIGVFKSLGVPNRHVFTYFALIGLMVAVLSILIGVAMGAALDLLYQDLLDQLQGYAVMEWTTNPLHYVTSSMVAVALCLLSTLFPAWAALQMKPVEAIQGREGFNGRGARKLWGGKGAGKEQRTGNGNGAGRGAEVQTGGGNARASGGASGGKGVSRPGGRRGGRRVPVAQKLTYRNLSRKPFRSLSTVFGVALSLALFLSMVIVMDVVVEAVEAGDRPARWDYEVRTGGFVHENISEGWSYPDGGFEDVNPGIYLPTRFSSGGREEGVMFYALEDPRDSFGFDFEEGGFADGGVVISRYVAGELDVDVGDLVGVQAPVLRGDGGYSMETVEFPVSGIHSNHLGYYQFMFLDDLAERTGLWDLVNVIYLDTPGGGSDRDFENQVIMTPGVISVTHKSDRENQLAQYNDLLLQSLLMLALLSAVLASAIVYNMFMISAAERKREYATMKTLGTSMGRLWKLVLLEAAYISGAGIALGAAGGYLLAYGMLDIWSEMGALNAELSFSWGGFAWGALMIAGVVLMVCWLTMRYIDRINIANVIRERSI